ncbi:AraC family transcriptional regulator [Anaerosporobacter faecicola]|uniref:AraC family transcriptional regulator n=1 Tax=Anaerosporobacter faecicola TaxID=2718714 RepID=UPI00143C65C4|nr:AraC family transcriptional regulator [Anaerosporobacter faecicola]
MDRILMEQLSKITKEEENILEGKKDINRSLYTKKEDWVIDCDNLLQKGKLIQVRPHTRFTHFPKHTHNYIEVIYMCKGHTTHIIDGNEVVLQEGDLLFLNQNAVQEILPAGYEDIAVNFIILPHFFDVAFSMMGEEENLLREFLIGCLRQDSSVPSYLYFHVADILPIQNLLENMIWTIWNDQQNKRSINQITMGLLFLQLLNHMDKVEYGQNPYEKNIVAHTLSYVEEHYKEGTLTELATLMNQDVYWLSREIKKLTGMTYKEILQTKRLNQAMYLLVHTKISVTDIIETIGYDNTSYFYRIFKKRFGKTPNAYREQIDLKNTLDER